MTATPARTTWSSTAALASAVVFMMLATIPTDGHGSQRIENVSPPSSTFHGVVTEAVDSIREHSPMATSPGRIQAFQFAALRLDSRKLGEGARKAVNHWPAAQEANPDWDWAKILIFLVQTALIVQGYDPGKPDGLMGPTTMLALVAWSAVSGPPWDGNDEMSYLWGLDDNVAFLLHGTLKAMGLSPGPRDEFLGRESVMALSRWDGTFRLAAMFMTIDESLGRETVMNDLRPAGPSDAGEAAATEERVDSKNAVDNSTEWDTSRRGTIANHCVKIVRCPNRHGILGNCLRNTCGERIVVAYCIPEAKSPYYRCKPEYLSSPFTATTFYATSRHIEPGEDKIITHESGVTLKFMACLDVPRHSAIFPTHVGNGQFICQYPEICRECVPYYQ